MDQSSEHEIPQIQDVESPSQNIEDSFPLHTLTLDKGNVKYRDIEAEHPRNEANTPLLMMTGWAMNQEVVGNTIKGLHEKGARAVPVDFEGSKLSIDDEADMLASLLTEMKEEKVDVLGQSMAAVTVLSMIEQHPELRAKIGKVLLVSPMGLGGKDSILGLGKRQLDEIRRDSKVEKNEERQAINKKVGESFGRFLRGNPLRAVKEIWGMKGADKYDVLEILKASGIKTAIIQGDLDRLNSSERVWNKIGEGSEPAWKVLTEEDYKIDKDEYDKKGIKPGQKVWNRDGANEPPPFDSITMTAGGHEIHGPKIMADKIIRTLDALDREYTGQELAEKVEQEKKDKEIEEAQGAEDDNALARARAELNDLVSENQIQ